MLTWREFRAVSSLTTPSSRTHCGGGQHSGKTETAARGFRASGRTHSTRSRALYAGVAAARKSREPLADLDGAHCRDRDAAGDPGALHRGSALAIGRDGSAAVIVLLIINPVRFTRSTRLGKTASLVLLAAITI